MFIQRAASLVSLCLCLWLGAATTSFATTPFIIDTDAGVDDIIAITYLLQRPDIDIKAITIASDGSAHCLPAMHNLLGLLQLMKHAPIPMACGRNTPLAGGHHFPPSVIQESDTLAGTAKLLPKVKLPKSQQAVDLFINTLMQAKQPITVLAIGPLTNLAEALQKEPQIKSHIQSIYIMGGAISVPGNIVEVDASIHNYDAEWNVFIDPLAADIVFNQNIPVVLVPLNVTSQLPIDEYFYERLKKAHHSPAAKYIFTLFKNNLHNLRSNTWDFWDPLAAVIASDNSIATFKEQRVKVVLFPEERSGATVNDKDNGQTLRVVIAADKKRFKTDLLDILNR